MKLKQNDIVTMTLTVGIGIALILLSMLSSCSPKVRYITQTVEIPKIQKEYVNRVDSVFIKDVDSIYTDRYIKSLGFLQGMEKESTIVFLNVCSPMSSLRRQRSR